MARKYKCICKICRKELTTDIAYCVQTKSKNYYCNKEEYEDYLSKQQIKSECIEYVAEVINMKFTPPAMIKLVNGLNQFYDYVVIKRAFKDNKDSIQWAIENKTFGSEFGKYKYIMSIVLNNIEKSHKAYLKEQDELKKLFSQSNANSVDVEILNFDRNEVKTNQSSDISMFLED